MSGLKDFQLAAVVRANDFDRAREFYTRVLGLEERDVSALTREGAFAAGRGTTLTIYEHPGLPASENTTLGFGVPAERFDDVIEDLRSRGVAFEEYDIPEIDLKTENGVASLGGAKVAWFRDSEDNIVSIGTM